MKKVIPILLLVLFFGSNPGTVFAHTLRIDKNIGVILHVDPDDAPVAGQESKFFVEIEDKSGRFNVNSPENCDCRLTVSQKDKVLKVMPVTTGGMYNQLRFTFPSSGTYHIIIEGKPNGKGVAFQAFKTSFEYFVAPGNSEVVLQNKDVNPLKAYMPYVAAAVGSAIVLMFVL